jgi:hypothetical protein
VRQLAVSDRITEETKKTVEEAFMEFHAVIRECAAGGLLRDLPPAFASAVMGAIAETTMEFIAREPTHVKRYTKAGFESFWRAVTG